jgi:hypothetical protein
MAFELSVNKFQLTSESTDSHELIIIQTHISYKYILPSLWLSLQNYPRSDKLHWGIARAEGNFNDQTQSRAYLQSWDQFEYKIYLRLMPIRLEIFVILLTH